MDLSAEAQLALSWVQGFSADSQSRIANAIKILDLLPVTSDLHQMLWKQLVALVEANSMWILRLDGLAKYCQVTRSPQSLLVLFERDRKSLPMLLEALSISPQISKFLVEDPEAFELLRITKGQTPTSTALTSDLAGECKPVTEESHLRRIVSRFKNREMIRIAYGQWYGDVSSGETYRQLAILENAIIQTTSAFVFNRVADRLGVPVHPSGRPAVHMIFAFDGLGGQCQGYNALVRLMILAETKGRTNSSRIVSNVDFFDRFASDWTELMAAQSAIAPEPIYQLTAPVQPQQMTSSWIVDIDVAFQHYDLTGRTWERELFVGARYVGGDRSSAGKFLNRLQPWIYRRYVGDADVAGLGAMQRKLKRRLETQSSHRSEAIDESRALGDLEQTIRFLQLLHGHRLPNLQTSNYFDSIEMLYQENVLLRSEYDVIKDSYAGLLEIKAIHELQADDYLEPAKLTRLRRTVAESIEICRTVVRQRLETEFPESTKTSDETDLILDPQPNAGWVTAVLQRHRFQETSTAYGRLMEMACENGHILSTRKCRFYLSNIAPRLLAAISETPDPDWTLKNMERVTNVLGGKGILWELLYSSPPIMQLLVRLCASSEYLVNILTQSPGMIDDLLNSLLLDRLPVEQEMRRMLEELCRRAPDIDLVLRDFKSAMHLQVGVRDVMSKESIVDTHIALASIAEVCLQQVIYSEYARMVRQFGNPTHEVESNQYKVTEYVVLALGKLGGREPNYHSDFSLVFLFDSDGTTRHEQASRSATVTSNRHFFEEFAQNVMKRVNRPAPHGRLYEIDIRFGPLGESGLLAMQFDQFVASLENPSTSVLYRQSLCKVRPILGSPELSRRSETKFHKVIESQPLTIEEQKELLRDRIESQQSASLHNIKRGVGGSLDIEFTVQWLQMTRAVDYQDIVVPNTLEAINRLQSCGVLDQPQASSMRDGYDYLRGIESALRLMNTDSKHDLPTKTIELEKLAYLIGAGSGEAMIKQVDTVRRRNRQLFESICVAE